MTRLKNNTLVKKPLAAAMGLMIGVSYVGNSLSKELSLEEVIVTAERRDTSLQETPAAIIAVTGETLEAVGINNLNEFTLTTPGINISGVNRSQQYIAMRGNVTKAGEPGAAQSIGFFIDGLYYGRSSMFNQSLADVDRIEVLRGPQGTLWGHNIVGGSINVITRDPTQDTEAQLKATVGNHGRKEISGRIAGGLTDSVTGQISFASETADGYVTNLDSGQDLGSEDAWLVRGKLIWDAADNLTAKLSVSQQVDTSGMGARNYLPSPTAIITPPPPGRTAPILATFDVPADYETKTYMGDDIGSNDIVTRSASLGVEYRFDNGMTFSSLTGMVDADGDVNNFSFFPIPESHGGLSRSTEYKDESFSQEFHLSGGEDGPVFWQVGAYYYNATNEQNARNKTSGLPFTRGGAQAPADAAGDNNGLVEFRVRESVDTESLALFGQATWSVNDWLDLTAGLRYTDVEKSGNFRKEGEGHSRQFTNQAEDCGAAPPYCQFAVTASDSWTNTSPKFTIDGHWDDVGPFNSVLAYGTYSEGWKEGGFQTPDASTQPVQGFAITPESAENREIGFKTTFWDRRASFNAAIFNTKYEGQQTIVNVGDGVRVFNLDSEIDGIEIDASVVVTDWLTLNYSVALYDSEYSDGAALGPNPEDSVAGNPTVSTPEKSWTLGWNAYKPLDGGKELFFRGSYSYSSDMEFDPDAPLAATQAASDRRLLPFTESKTLNATLGIRSENWEISVWGRNLTDEYVVTNVASFTDFWVLNAWAADNPSIEVFEGVRTDPRAYGLSVTWNLN